MLIVLWWQLRRRNVSSKGGLGTLLNMAANRARGKNARVCSCALICDELVGQLWFRACGKQDATLRVGARMKASKHGRKAIEQESGSI